jgi:hypothetical protein
LNPIPFQQGEGLDLEKTAHGQDEAILEVTFHWLGGADIGIFTMSAAHEK